MTLDICEFRNPISNLIIMLLEIGSFDFWSVDFCFTFLFPLLLRVSMFFYGWLEWTFQKEWVFTQVWNWEEIMAGFSLCTPNVIVTVSPANSALQGMDREHTTQVWRHMAGTTANRASSGQRYFCFSNAQTFDCLCDEIISLLKFCVLDLSTMLSLLLLRMISSTQINSFLEHCSQFYLSDTYL